MPRLSFWKVVAALLLAAGAYSTFVRFYYGLGASTHLSDQFPWGLWIGFDVICGVGLAAGGFTLAAVVYIFNIKKFEPIIRPTILTAFLGYLLVIVGLLFDLGRPLQIWHAIIMWNPHSVMFEVAWCVMLYTTVLSLEFAPVVLERFKLTRTISLLRKITIPIIIVGVLLSTLHQSSLGSLYLIVPYKLYPLWYSPLLPVFFFMSAVAVGCAMVIFESFLSARAFKRGLEMGLLADVARISVVMLAVYLMLKFMDLYNRHLLGLLFVNRYETYLYWLEIGAGVIFPMLWLASSKVRKSPAALFTGAATVILGFVLNRMNVTITGFESYAGHRYFPTWMEISVTVSIVTAGFVAFSFATKYLNVFDAAHEHHPAAAGTHAEAAAEELRFHQSY